LEEAMSPDEIRAALALADANNIAPYDSPALADAVVRLAAEVERLRGELIESQDNSAHWCAEEFRRKKERDAAIAERDQLKAKLETLIAEVRAEADSPGDERWRMIADRLRAIADRAAKP